MAVRLQQLCCGGINRNGDLFARAVPGRLNRRHQRIKRRLIRRKARRKAALITLAGCKAAIVQVLAECGEDLGASTQCVAIGGGAHRNHHELLEVGGVFGMLATIKDVEQRHRELHCGVAAEFVPELVAVQRGARVGGGE